MNVLNLGIQLKSIHSIIIYKSESGCGLEWEKQGTMGTTEIENRDSKKSRSGFMLLLVAGWAVAGPRCDLALSF